MFSKCRKFWAQAVGPGRPRLSGSGKWAVAAAGGNEGFSFGSLLDSDARVLKDPARESAVMSSNIPYTIVRCSRIQDVPGGGSGLRFMQVGIPRSSSAVHLWREGVPRERKTHILGGRWVKRADALVGVPRLCWKRCPKFVPTQNLVGSAVVMLCLCCLSLA